MLNTEYYWADIAQTNKLIHVVEINFTTGYAWHDILVLYSEAHKKFYWASGESTCACCSFDWDNIEALDEMSSGTAIDVIAALDAFWEENFNECEGANYERKEQAINKVKAFTKSYLTEE